MFRYGWDSGSRNMSRVGLVQHMPQSTPQVACRICNQIFMGSRALVHHLQSHVTEDGSISKRQQEIKFKFKFKSHQREGNDDSIYQLQSNFALPTTLQVFQPSVQNCYSPVQNPAPAVPERHHVSATAAARFDVPWLRPQQTPSFPPAKQRMREQLCSDFIKPFIDQLDKPIRETVELISIDDDEKKLDLTLKL